MADETHLTTWLHHCGQHSVTAHCKTRGFGVFLLTEFPNRLSPETPIFISPCLSFDLTPDNLVHLSRAKMQTHHWLMVQTPQMVRQPIMIRGRDVDGESSQGLLSCFSENHSRLPLLQLYSNDCSIGRENEKCSH